MDSEDSSIIKLDGHHGEAALRCVCVWETGNDGHLGRVWKLHRQQERRTEHHGRKAMHWALDISALWRSESDSTHHLAAQQPIDRHRAAGASPDIVQANLGLVQEFCWHRDYLVARNLDAAGNRATSRRNRSLLRLPPMAVWESSP